MRDSFDTLLSGPSGPHIADLFHRYSDNPASVDPSWAELFAELAQGASSGPTVSTGQTPSLDVVRGATLDSVRALMLIRVYRVRGHLIANFDPLGLGGKKYHPELDPQTWGFTETDLDRPIFINFVLGLETATIREIVAILQETYCGSIGVEFMHIQDPEEKAWIQQRIESIHNRPNSPFWGSGPSWNG